MLRYKTETRPGLVALYDIQPGNAAGQFLQPGARTGAYDHRNGSFKDQERSNGSGHNETDYNLLKTQFRTIYKCWRF